MGEEEVEFKNQKSLFKSVKNISVLNVAFSKSVLLLIKNGCINPFFIKEPAQFEKQSLFFVKRSKIRTKKGFVFSLRNILLRNDGISFYSFKISRLWGKRKLNLRTKKAFLKVLRTFRFLM